MASGSLQDVKNRRFWLAIFAEFLGTLLLVLIACGSCARFDVSQPADVVQISLAFGLSVSTIVWSIAHISGGHINPAVTVGFMVTRKLSFLGGILYIVSQTAGAVVGAGLLDLVSPPGINDKLGFTFPSTVLADYMLSTFLVEFIISFVLVLTVFSTCDSKRPLLNGSGPLTIGLSITMCHLWAIPYTGSGMNPARAFGSAVMSGNLNAENAGIHCLYWVGPMLGGAMAALLYDLLFAANASIDKAKAFFTRRNYDDDQFDVNGRDTTGGNRVGDKSDIRLHDAPAA